MTRVVFADEMSRHNQRSCKPRRNAIVVSGCVFHWTAEEGAEYGEGELPLGEVQQAQLRISTSFDR